MAVVASPRPSFFSWCAQVVLAPVGEVGRVTLDCFCLVGDLVLFLLEIWAWLLRGIPRQRELLPSLYVVGVQSLPVTLVTGSFIGMVIVVQSYDQFLALHMETSIGATTNLGLVKELGPVLAATMLAGRVGGSMAAEIGTMKISEQIDALQMLGAHPVSFLVVPRFVACVMLVPLLALFADGAGVVGGWFFATQILGIDNSHYWHHSEAFVTAYDVVTGCAKCLFFGGAIAVIACHRGFHCRPGAEGVGRAATEAFVWSFLAILVLDFGLGVTINEFESAYRAWMASAG